MKDLIERQAAIDALGERPMVWNGNDYELGARNQYDADVLALETVPSAQPERKRGKWEITNLGAVGVFDSCSECKRVVKHKAPFYNYCPNCGADMREVDE
jgi:hypothetical protein